MKKMMLLTGILVFMILALVPVLFFAQSNTGLYMLSTVCPQTYIDYAETNASRFVHGTGDELDVSSISIGTPFSFAQDNANIYYFPVLYNGVITYLLRVYPDGDGGFDAVISSFLVEELESLAPLTTVDCPLQLKMDGYSIVAVIGTETYVLYTYPQGVLSPSSSVSVASSGASQYITLNAKKATTVPLNELQTRSNQYKFIAIDLSESTPKNVNTWCGAYCAAAILRSVGTATPMGHPTAEDVLSIIYPNGYTNASTTTPAQLIAAAHEYEVYPIFVNGTMSTDFLINQLNDVWPIFMLMRNSASNENHAMVLRGYDLRSSVWSIWNPWYGNHFESFPIGGTYSPAVGFVCNYSYVATIHNWMCE